MFEQISCISAVKPSRVEPENKPDTPLHGFWLIIARIVWIALVLFILACIIASIASFRDLICSVSLGVFFYLFPNGQFLPRWTRWLAVVQETMQPAHISLWLRPPTQNGTQEFSSRANAQVLSKVEERNEW